MLIALSNYVHGGPERKPPRFCRVSAAESKA